MEQAKPAATVLNPFKWRDTAQHIYDEYLSKEFTDRSTLDDWKYTYNDVIIHRPNHGLAHTLRVASYVSLVVKAYNTFNKPPLTQKDEEDIQLSLLFFVVGRDNEVARKDDLAKYAISRQKCADAFQKYVTGNPNIKLSQERINFFASGLRDAYSTSPPEYVVMRICHNLDLIRCYGRADYEQRLKEIAIYTGSITPLLVEVVRECMRQTGDRITDEQGYYGPLFTKCSRSVDETLAKVQDAIRSKQEAILELLKPQFPEDFQAPIPQTPWEASPQLWSRTPDGDKSQPYQKCEVKPEDPEAAFVLRLFMHSKPPKYSIRKIYFVHDPDSTQAFEASVKNIDKECKNPIYAPKGKAEHPKTLRDKVIARWERSVAPFTPVEVTGPKRKDVLTDVKVLPLWQGTDQKKVDSICKSGFTFFGKHHHFDHSAGIGENKSTDIGFFGSGIYFSNSAQYASMYSGGGNLLLAWVAMREPYPVVNDDVFPKPGADMKKLKGMHSYQNYNAHYIPVASIRPNDPSCMIYYACDKMTPPAWDEYCVFNKQQCLPRFWVELGLDTPSHPLKDALALPPPLAIAATKPSVATAPLNPDAVLELKASEDLARVGYYSRLKISDEFAANHEWLTELSKKLGTVTELDFSASGITDLGLIALTLSKATAIHTVQLSQCRSVTDEGLEALSTFCPKLVSLDLQRCTGLTATGLTKLGKACPALSTLNLSDCQKLKDKELSAAAKSFTGLTTLNLSYCTQVTDKALTAFFKACPNLRTLNVSGCIRLTDRAFASIQEMNAGFFGVVTSSHATLTSIDISDCQLVGDDGLRSIAQKCPDLTSLSIRGCEHVTDSGIGAVAKSCKRLTTLNIGGCSQITENGLRAILAANPKLSSLILVWWDQLRDSGLKAIAEHCPNLTSLSLYGCTQFTDVGLSRVATSCRSLTTLHLGKCRQFTDDGLAILSKSCTNLTYLDLRGCSELTHAGITALAKTCVNLTYLDLAWCTKLTESDVEKTKTLLPSTEIKF